MLFINALGISKCIDDIYHNALHSSTHFILSAFSYSHAYEYLITYATNNILMSFHAHIKHQI